MDVLLYSNIRNSTVTFNGMALEAWADGVIFSVANALTEGTVLGTISIVTDGGIKKYNGSGIFAAIVNAVTLSAVDIVVDDTSAAYVTVYDLNKITADYVQTGWTITYVPDGGAPAPDPVLLAVEVPVLPVVTKAGYTFLGWFYDSGFTLEATAAEDIFSNTTLYASWEETKHTLSLNANGGTVDPLSYDTARVPALPTPTLDFYTFGGWFYDNTTFVTPVVLDDLLTADTTIYAKWTETVYTVTYDVNGGGTVDPLSFDDDYIPAVLATPVREDYTFGGWFYDFDTLIDPVTTGDRVYGNTTIFAKWTETQYVVTLNANGGSVDPASIEDSYIPELPTPTRSGNYSFGGWFYDNTTFLLPVTTGDRIEDTITIYALWNETAFDVTFVENGGSAVSDLDNVLTLPVTFEATTKAGFLFGGWFYDSALTQLARTLDVLTADVTLYAKWYTEVFGVSFTGCDEVIPTQSVAIGGKAVLPTIVPVKEGKVFTEWQLSGSAYDFDSVVTTNLVLTAVPPLES